MSSKESPRRIPRPPLVAAVALTAMGIVAERFNSYPQNPLGGFGPAISRPFLTETTLLPTEMRKIPESVYRQVWQEHFAGQEKIMPYEAWYKNASQRENYGIGQHMAGLASSYYQTEHLPGESWPEYYQRYIAQLHNLANKADLDFTVLTSTLVISSENMDSQPLKKDIDEARIQAIVPPITRNLGIEHWVLGSVSQSGWVSPLFRQLGIKEIGGLPQNGMSYFDAIRFKNVEVTSGEMDYETGIKAEYYREAPSELKTSFNQQFPDIVSQYDRINHQKDRISYLRSQMKQSSQAYLTQYPDSLDLFRAAHPAALDAIGLGENLDDWQKYNYTFAWIEAIKTYDNGPVSSTQIANSIKSYAQENPDEFGLKFMSQQFQNPKFLDFLKRQAKSPAEVAQLNELINLRKSFNELTYEQIAIIQTAQSAEGKYELNSYFQNMTTVMITKALSNRAGKFSKNPDSIRDHIYRVAGMREIAPVSVLVLDSVFARSALIDAPYAPNEVNQNYDQFVGLLKTYGLISKNPDQDMSAFYDVIENLIQQNRGALKPLEDQQWAYLMRNFRNQITARFYSCKIDVKEIAQMPNLAKFEDLLLKNRMIYQRFNQDRSAIYEAAFNIYWGKYDVYYWMNEKDRNEVDRYFNNQMPELSKIVENSQIAWDHYPPFNRSQVIMSKFLR